MLEIQDPYKNMDSMDCSSTGEFRAIHDFEEHLKEYASIFEHLPIYNIEGFIEKCFIKEFRPAYVVRSPVIQRLIDEHEKSKHDLTQFEQLFTLTSAYHFFGSSHVNSNQESSFWKSTQQKLSKVFYIENLAQGLVAWAPECCESTNTHEIAQSLALVERAKTILTWFSSLKRSLLKILQHLSNTLSVQQTTSSIPTFTLSIAHKRHKWYIASC